MRPSKVEQVLFILRVRPDDVITELTLSVDMPTFEISRQWYVVSDPKEFYAVVVLSDSALSPRLFACR